MSHIAVERNRRRQMNEHLKVLRSLTPCFYIKRGDQASIIAGVVEFIKELHQVLQSLESKKRRKSLSPSPNPSPRSSLLLQLTPHQYHDHHINMITNHNNNNGILMASSTTSNNNIIANNNNNTNNDDNTKKELVASCNSPLADVEAKISGSNVVLKTVSRRIPGQVVKIIGVLEKFSFDILNLNISSMEDTVLYSFLIKIGLDCRLSLEELSYEVQQTFSSSSHHHAP